MKTSVRLKKSKAFERNDIFLYVLLFLTVILLFVFAVILPKKVSDEGFEISIDGKTAFTFYYEAPQSYVINNDFAEKIDVSLSDCTVTCYYDIGKTHYNVIRFDIKGKSVKVKESNCSLSPDCVYSPAISDSGAIICVPHKLKITPLKDGGFTPPTTG